uniref:Protogenin n=1 Tax=Lygus hesperus TaxID=30085 RepID=A0A0A9YRL0_LYGHE
MAARVLISVAFTVGLITGKPTNLTLGVIEEGGDVVGVRAHRLSLRCTSKSPPSDPAYVDWTYNDVPIQKGDPRRYVAEDGSTLVISKVVHNKKKGETDAGVYQCKVRNSNGAILSTPRRVTIASMAHEFSRSPSNTTIVEGNLLRFSCSIDSTPNANITWLKDGEPLHNSKRYFITESELYVTSVKLEDSGSYECSATNALINKKRISHAGEVTVVGQTAQPLAVLTPEARAESNPRILRHGQKEVLVCAASGIPRPNLQWTHLRSDGTTRTKDQDSNNGLNIFTFDRVDVGDSGVYTCVATQSSNGNISKISTVIYVEVEVPPMIVDKPKSQIFPAAKTVRIECEVRGVPTPQVVWYKDGAKLHINGRIKQRAKELVLGAVVTQDTGIYQCFATSSAGIAWAAGRLVVNSSIDQPAPPTGLKCRTLSSAQVALSWNQIVKSDLRAFSVHYFPTDGGDEGKDVTLNDSYIVDKLQPHTNYTFYIRSYSSKSASEQSKRVICTTAEALPTGAPKLTVTATSSHCITIEWSTLPMALARGNIVSYEIQWKKTTQTSAYFVVVPGGTSNYVISGLQGGNDYMVRVIGATSLGWPELNDNQAPWLKVSTTKDESSTLQSPSVQLYSVNSTIIEVLWKYENDSSVDGFKLTFRNSVDIDMKQVSVPSSQRSYIIPNSEPSKWYDVSVNVYRGSYEGESCFIRYNTGDLLTSKPTLPVPTDLDAFPTSQHSINVSWAIPSKEPLRNSIRFRLFFTLMHSNGQKPQPQILETNETSALLTGLMSRTYYKVYVQAYRSDEISPFSFPVACKTLPEVLGLVDNIGWKVLSNSSIEVTWSALPFPVTGYTVFYNARVTSDQTDQWQHVAVKDNKTSIKLTDLKSNMDYVVRIRGESGSSHGPLSADTYISLLLDGGFMSNGDIYEKTNSSDQILGIVVGVSISICCIALCTGSLLYRKKCSKHQAQVPSSLSDNGQCSAQCEQSSLASIEMKDIHPTSPVNGLKLPLIINGTLPNGNNREKIVRITDNPQGRRGERSSSHSTDEGDSLLSGPELDMEPEEPTQITLLVDSSLVVVASAKETAPDDGFHETHVSAHQW